MKKTAKKSIRILKNLLILFAILFAFNFTVNHVISFFVSTKTVNKNAAKFIDEYIDNSIDMELDYKSALRPVQTKSFTQTQRDSLSKEIEKYHPHGVIRLGISMRGSRKAKVNQIKYWGNIVISKNDNRYYLLLYIHDPFTFGALLREDKMVTAKVNKYQLNDSTYGTSENPIPVLYFEIPKYKGWKDYEEAAITNASYRDAVYCYLTYLISKNQFDILFKNN